MSPELSGYNVLVTGASAGIRIEVARVLGVRGARVIAAARRADPLEAVVGDLPGDGHLALPLDVLLSDEAAGISGRLLSAQWDPWRDPGFGARLRSNSSLGHAAWNRRHSVRTDRLTDETRRTPR